MRVMPSQMAIYSGRFGISRQRHPFPQARASASGYTGSIAREACDTLNTQIGEQGGPSPNLSASSSTSTGRIRLGFQQSKLYLERP